MTSEDIKREIGDLVNLVESPGWARFLKEADGRRSEHLEKVMSLKPAEVNVRHLIVRSAAHKENEELVGWPASRLKSLLAAEARK